MSLFSALYVSRRAALAFGGLGIFWGAFAATIPDIKARLGTTDAEFGFVLLGSAFGLALAMMLTPRVDKVLGDRGLQVALGALALAWLIPGLVTAPILFGMVLVVVGAASGTVDILMNARVSELEAQTGKSLMNANHGVFSLGYAIAAILAGAAREMTIPPFFVFLALAVIALFILPYIRMHVAQVEEPETGRGKLPIWPLLVCGGIVICAFMSEATVESWSALHIERTLGGGAAEGAFGPAILGFTMALGRFSGQVITERFSETLVIIAAAIISASGALLAAGAPTPQVAYLGFGILGLGVSVIGPIGLAYTGRIVPPHLRTIAISRVALMGFTGFFFAPTLMGITSEVFGLRVAFAGVGGVLVLIVPLAFVATRWVVHKKQGA